ncbi:Phospholipase A2-beta [Cardamine amara subsp. amara]|uniref:phospholipase A2 n=1 Tax=Cardamine amara subsp. amara TaxID=228776 RepID=A0ABD1BUB8_CARAN
MKIRTSLAAAFFFVVLLLVDVACSEKCTRTCIAKNCNTLTLKYGKYCGIGHTGCPGEEPCDDLDACCKAHDNCVDTIGLTTISCHKNLQSCVSRLTKSIKQSKNKKVGFSTQCPYSVVIPKMNQGMEIGILFSNLGNRLGINMKVEL